VRRGLARSRALAAAAIGEGRVLVDGRPATKPAHRVADGAAIEIAGEDGYVSRSAHKLVAALDAFPVEVSGRLALDVGASTGGFTQVLLERGAAEVIALDVGHGQLAPTLREDPRVRVVEGEHARDLDADRLAVVAGTDRPPGLVVVDVSFIGLGRILPALVRTAPGADLVVLVKPQFEVGRVRGGVVRDRAARHGALTTVLRDARALGLDTAGVIASPLVGSAGNQEYLAWLRPGAGGDPSEWEQTIAALA